jgi:uncharacterized membrane protein (UPF0127 family)
MQAKREQTGAARGAAVVAGDGGAGAEKTIWIVNATRREIVCDRAQLADNPLRRLRGLLGRRSLAGGEGLLLTPAPSIHTAFMRFPIDVVFLDSEHRVLRVVRQMEPWRAASAKHARAVLEMADGEADRRGIRVGDVLDWPEA